MAIMYWVGGTGSWTMPEHWSLTSGGATAGRIPTAADSVQFDENSFLSESQVVTVDIEAQFNHLRSTNVKNSPTLTYSGEGKLVCNGTAVELVGFIATLNRPVTLECVYNIGPTEGFIRIEGVKLIDTIRFNTQCVFSLNAPLDVNDFYVQGVSRVKLNRNELTANSVVCNGTGSIDCVDSNISCGTLLITSTANIDSSGSNITMTSLGNAVLNCDGKILYNVTFDVNANIAGSTVFNDITIVANKTLTFEGGKTHNIGNIIFNENCTLLCESVVSPVTLNLPEVRILKPLPKGVTKTNVIIITPKVPVTNLFWVGNGGNWSDPLHWSNISGWFPVDMVPTISNNVTFDNNSFYGKDQTVTIDTPIKCNDILINLGYNMNLVNMISTVHDIKGSVMFNTNITYTDKAEGSFRLVSSGPVAIDFGKNKIFGLRLDSNRSNATTFIKNDIIVGAGGIQHCNGILNAKSVKIRSDGPFECNTSTAGDGTKAIYFMNCDVQVGTSFKIISTKATTIEMYGGSLTITPKDGVTTLESPMSTTPPPYLMAIDNVILLGNINYVHLERFVVIEKLTVPNGQLVVDSLNSIPPVINNFDVGHITIKSIGGRTSTVKTNNPQILKTVSIGDINFVGSKIDAIGGSVNLGGVTGVNFVDKVNIGSFDGFIDHHLDDSKHSLAIMCTADDTSNVEGYHNSVLGPYSHADGAYNSVSGPYSTVEGFRNVLDGINVHGEGSFNGAVSGPSTINIVTIDGSRASSDNNFFTSKTPFTAGSNVIIYRAGKSPYINVPILQIVPYGTGYAHYVSNEYVIGMACKYASSMSPKNNNSTFFNMHMEGYNNLALGNGLHIEGSSNLVTGSCSHVEGNNNVAKNAALSHIEGGSNAIAPFANIARIISVDTLAKSITLDDASNFPSYTGYITLIGANSSYLADRICDSIQVISKVGNTLMLNVDTVSVGFKFAVNMDSSVAYSHVEGSSNISGSNRGHVEGTGNIAYGEDCHVEGTGNIAYGSHCEGRFNYAAENGSHCEGMYSAALSSNNHVEGYMNATSSNGCVYRVLTAVDSTKTVTIDNNMSLNENDKLYMLGEKMPPITVVVKKITVVSGKISVVLLSDTNDIGNAKILIKVLTGSNQCGTHAEGIKSVAIGKGTHSEGFETSALGDYSHVEGFTNVALGNATHVEGYGTIINGAYSHGEGYYNRTTSTETCHVEGKYNSVTLSNSNVYSVISSTVGNTITLNTASGLSVGHELVAYIANGNALTGIRIENIVDNNVTLVADQWFSPPNVWKYVARVDGSNITSHIEGYNNITTRSYTHVEGLSNIASGEGCHVEGANSIAEGYYSHAQNRGTISAGVSQTTIGEYNIRSGSPAGRGAADHAFIIGNGTSNAARSNAMSVTWDGTLNAAKDVQINGTSVLDRPLSANRITGGTMGSNVIAGASNIALLHVRNVAYGMAEPNNAWGVDGDIYIKYKA